MKTIDREADLTTRRAEVKETLSAARTAGDAEAITAAIRALNSIDAELARPS